MTHARILGLAALVVLSLTGCGGGPGGGPLPTLSPGASGSPAPTAAADARETGLVAPASVFGGDCGALFTDAEVSAALGVSVHAQADDWDPGYAIARVGGITCGWEGAVVGDTPFVSVVVVPAGLVSYTPTTGCGIPLGEGQGCALEAETNGIKLSGAILDSWTGLAATPAMQSALLAVFETKAAEASAAPILLPAIGSWANPVNCAGIVAAGDFSAVPGLGAGTTGEDWGGFDGYFQEAKWRLWETYSPIDCVLHGSSAEVSFHPYGGLRWLGAQRAAAEGAAPLAVAGVDEVWVKARDGRQYISVLDGPNWLTFDVAFIANAPAIAQQLVAALDTTAIS